MTENTEAKSTSTEANDNTAVLVDGRTDVEKLVELLPMGERTELDYKETLDLRNNHDALEFVKDAVSMANHYPGGYFIIGAHEDGTPSDRADGTSWSQFDGAKLTAKIQKYIDAPLVALSNVHELEGHTYCLICIHSLEDGLPIPFSKYGGCRDDEGNDKTVFRKGEILRRDGAGNDYIQYQQWGNILARHDEDVRRDERKRIDGLVESLTDALSLNGKVPPLVPEMSEEALFDALTANFEQENSKVIKRYAHMLAHSIDDGNENRISLLASIGCFAVHYSNDEVLQAVEEHLYSIYRAELRKNTRNAYDIANAIYEIGSAMVRAERWELINPLVNRPVEVSSTYTYASWVRECQVEASNSNMYPKNGSGMMISVCLDEIKNHKLLRPDCIGIETVDQWEKVNDYVLDSLCSFDILYCLCVYVAGDGRAGAYPACIYYQQKRVSLVLERLFAKDDSMRRELLPNASDQEIATGYAELRKIMSTEGGGRGWHFLYDLSVNIERFMNENRGSTNGERSAQDIMF